MTVVGEGSRDVGAAAGLVPVTDIRRVAIGSDHTGVALRRTLVQHLRGRGLAVTDLGTDGTASVDYPDIAGAVALAVARREADAGIVIDGAGIGSAIAANKVRGIRAAMSSSRPPPESRALRRPRSVGFTIGPCDISTERSTA